MVKEFYYSFNLIYNCKIYFTYKYAISFNCFEQTRYFNILTKSYVSYYFTKTLMSGDDKDDDITVVASHSAEYAVSESGSSPQRIKTGKPRLSEAEFLW